MKFSHVVNMIDEALMSV